MSVAALRGVQVPRIRTVPEYEFSRGPEVLEVCEMAGLRLDTWQADTLTDALGVRPDGKWASFEVAGVVPRQNGKGAVLTARQLGGLFVLGEAFIVHSAHQFDTSLEAFRRLLWLIEDCPDLDRQVKRVSRSHGEEGIELKSGQRIRFRTRTAGGGRGFSCDCLILDEAMILKQSAHAALLPTLSARPNPQVWFMASAVDREIHEDGVVLARVRERGMKGDKSLAYFEWSLDFDNPGEVDEHMAVDEGGWAHANPALGIRISSEQVGYEQSSMDSRSFAVERLGVGDWPPVDQDESVINMALWGDLFDPGSSVDGAVRFAFDVKPDRAKAAIAVAGMRADGRLHVEVVDHRAGTGWVIARLAELDARHPTLGPAVYDARGPAASLLPNAQAMGVEVEDVSATEHAQACGGFIDAVEQRTLRHLGTPELANAIKGAGQRTLGDAWAWSRRSSAVDISPLVACTLALWSFREYRWDGPLIEVF